VLAFDEEAGKPLVSKSATLVNSIVIPPCYIGEFVHLENAVVGPFVSLGEATHVKDSVIKNSLIQKNSTIENVVLNDSMIGSNVHYRKNKLDISIGDYCTHHE
jgi:glucose-1-phosphate thymidylyltransferase